MDLFRIISLETSVDLLHNKRERYVRLATLAQKDEDKLLKRLLNASDRERTSAKKKQAAELKKAEKRKTEVDGLFAKQC